MLLQRAPVRLLGTTTVLLLAMLGFSLQLVERRINHDLDHYANGLWLALVSMTGIGYGDFYPQTILGRLLAAAAFSWGATMASLGVLYVLRTMQLTESEQRIQHMMVRTSSLTAIKQSAAA